ncbi:MAG: heme-binding domain-containing protein [Bacteroidales bacterium]|jgi:signal recognition particle subunit SEC65|nr:heme-binding domain-containing protein [Bacteroidales bacterium]
MKKFLWILLIIVLVLQVIPTNRPETKTNNPNDLIVNNQVPAEVADMLRNACYDCHSNESKYPWYAYVAPVSYLINKDIREGRKHLNFSDWQGLETTKKLKLLDEISDEVGGGDMPYFIYPPLHPEARLSDADRQKMVDWTTDFGDGLLK